MTCKKFQDLNIIEKRQFIGQLSHLFQSSDEWFNLGESILRIAESRGELDTIKINNKNGETEESRLDITTTII